jgi:hypothetical protein
MSPWLSSPELRHNTDRAMRTEFGLVSYLEGPTRLSKQNLSQIDCVLVTDTQLCNLATFQRETWTASVCRLL